jgi:hypothetical protein
MSFEEMRHLFDNVIYPLWFIFLFFRIYFYCANISYRDIIRSFYPEHEPDITKKEVIGYMAISYLATHLVTSLFNRKTK